jgi:hypothetical protein
MFDPNNVSKTELEFIRVYVTAMRREYALLQNVLALMHPENFDVHCVVTATRIARELQVMHAEFDSSLHALSARHKFRCRSGPDGPTVDQLADLFTLSFFKVVTDTPVGKYDDGWFSGEPGAWKKMLMSLKPTNSKHGPKNMVAYLKEAMKLFGQKSDGFILWDDTPANTWNLPKNAFKYKNKLEDFVDNYDDDDVDPDDFFQDLFDNDTD